MQTEIYERPTTQPLEADVAGEFSSWGRRAELVSALKLPGQRLYMETVQKARSIPFQVLSQDQLKVWRDYLPQRYLEDETLYESSGDFRSRDFRRLSQYAYDLIPLQVLEVWETAREGGFFDSYEIWTSERNPDPILIGCVGPLSFIIARWGESLKPFEEIRQEVQHPRRWG